MAALLVSIIALAVAVVAILLCCCQAAALSDVAAAQRRDHRELQLLDRMQEDACDELLEIRLTQLRRLEPTTN